MKTTAIAALALFAMAGTALAAPRETQTFAGPYDVYGTPFDADPLEPDALNSTVSATFAATGYNVIGVRIAMTLTSAAPFTYASDMTVRVTPPSGAPFDMVMSTLDGTYEAYSDLTCTYPIDAGTTTAGTWQFQLWDIYQDADPGSADATVTNLRISLESDEPPAVAHDFGSLNGADATATVSDYVGGQIKWFKVTLPQDASAASGFWMDVNTKGTSTAEGFNVGANDTEVGLYDSAGAFVASRDDIAYPAEPESAVTFGSADLRTHGASAFVYDGRDGDLTAGTYYIGAGTYDLEFYDAMYNIDSTSDSPGGSLVVNVFNNFPAGPAACSVADLGSQGGAQGQDNRLDNNDFIVFIDYFFNQNALADVGIQGGVAGHDGLFDNNDFIVFIDTFFNDQASCTG